MIEAKAFRIFIRIYFLIKSERLSANVKLTLHKALIRSVMTYACSAWEFTAECHLLKLQRLQNRVLRTIGNFPRRTSVHEIMNMEMFATLDKAKPNTDNVRDLNLAVVMCTTVQVSRLLDCRGSVSY
jgi:hypothetical protein